MTTQDDPKLAAAVTEQLAKDEKPQWRWTPLITTFSIVTIVATLPYVVCFILGFASPAFVGSQFAPVAFDASQIVVAPLFAIVVIIAAPIAGMRGGKGRLVGLICGLVTLLLPAIAIIRVATFQVGY